MILDCVLTAVNENTAYIDFVPYFITAWNKLYPDIDVKIILISEKIPDNLQHLAKNLILFKPIPNMSTAFISQYIRILYPSILNYKNGVLITDIDMIPTNRTYFIDNIKNYENGKFIYMRNVVLSIKQIAICYNVASPQIWKEINKINSEDQIIEELNKVYSKCNYIEGTRTGGWETDQKNLYKLVFEWNKKSNNLIILNDNDTKFNRLSMKKVKNINDSIKSEIKSGLYSDYHCLRPYLENKILNDMILEII